MKKFLLSFLCFLLAVAGGYAEGSDDFDKLSSNNQYQNFTTPNGWSCTNAQRVNIDNTIAPTINGKTSAKGTITSPTLTGGCGTLSLKYAFTFSENKGVSFNVAIKQSGVVVKKFDVVNKTAVKGTIYTWEQEVGVQGDFVIYITNNSPTNKDSNVDRFSIWNIEWTTPGEETLPQLDKPVFSPTEYNFVKSTIVTISEPQESTIYYYTLDGTDPTTDSEIYPTSGIELTATKTIKAIAVKDGYENSEVATATYTRVVAAPEITFEGEETFEEVKVVTIEVDEDATAYYTLNGKSPTNESTKYVEPFAIKANATLKVVAYEEGQYVSPVVEQVFKMKKDENAPVGDPTNTATLVTNTADLAVGDVVVIVASKFDVALSTTQNENNRGMIGVNRNGDDIKLAANGGNDVQRLTLEEGTKAGTYAFSTGLGYLYAASSSKNYLRTQTTNNDNSSWKIDIAANGVATIKAQGTYTHNWLRYNSASNNGQLFSCYASGQSDVSLYKVKFEVTYDDYVLNVTEAGWATLYLDYAVTIPDGVTCYVIDEVGVGDESVILDEVEGSVLPANTAVIVNAAEGEYTFEVTDATATIESKMEGTTKNEYIAEEAYVLGRVDGKVGLYKAEMMGGVFLNNANKAYLPATKVPSNAKALKFNFDTTGVEGVKVETAGKKVIYDLSGRRVNEMTQPGIYIVNGKKVMVK